MYRLSCAITDALCKAEAVEEREKELYAYGFFVFLSQGIYFLLSLTFGLLLDIPVESVMFFFMFSKLRRYAGGFHASKESICLFSSTLMLLLSSVVIRELEYIGSIAIPGCVIVLASFVVYELCPLDSPEKPLDESEKKRYKKKSAEILMTIVLITFVGCLLKAYWILYVSTTGIVTESGLLILGKVKFMCAKHRSIQ